MALARRWTPLWVKTNHSFLEGASFPEEIVDRAADLGHRAIAITDRDGVYGVVRAHVRARERGMRVIPGAEITVEAVATRERQSSTQAARSRVVLLARTREGYARLCRLSSIAHARCEKGDSLAKIAEVCEAAGGIVALAPDPALLAPLREAYGGDLHALVVRHLRADDEEREAALRRESAHLRVACAGGVEVLYHDRSRRPLQDVLTCIRHKRTLANAGTLIRANAEHALPDTAAIGRLFADAPEMLERSAEIADACTFDLSQIRYRYPAEALPDGRSESEHLRELTLAGARARYGGDVPPEVLAQIDRELALIADLDYGGYFLTMHEIVAFCRERGILCQGRGSAANSAVCYCLGVTAIDPVRMGLLFERFLSRERAEPPDIDLDIEHDRREEVIQHVYERYGRRRAAMVANVIRYRARSAVRDVGKVLGIPETELDGVARMLRHHTTVLDRELVAGCGLDPDAPSTAQLLALVLQIQDFPRHLSIHPGGFLLGHEPVDHIVPIEPATMEGRTVVQWDKQDIEDLGLFKVDLLGLGSLSVVHRCLDLLRAHEGVDLDMARVPAEDAETYEMVSRADTVGVFQIESRAQMAMLPRLRPRTFYDLVIQVAIVRPGPIQGDMIHPYLKRRNGQEPVDYPHPGLRSVLERTLGVPIFQEQVMKLAIVAAGYTPGEADQLRRDIAGWRSAGLIEQHAERLVSRMVERGIPREFAERVFSQIRGFGEYGFPESHAASFALLAYVTAWLKRHHPAVFACGLLNAQPMGFYAPSTIVEDARRHEVEVRPIDIERSAWDCTIERDARGRSAVRMGLRYVKGLGERERARIEAAALASGVARPGGPRFESLEEVVRRTALGERSLVALAEAGAFESFGVDRRDAIWQVRGLSKHARDALPLSPADPKARFASLSCADEIVWDYRASDHSSRGHPMARMRAALAARGIPDAAAVRRLPHGSRVDYAGMVICRQRPQTASGVTFFTLEDETGFVNLVLWRPVFEAHALVAQIASPLGVTGRVQASEGVVHVVADALWVPDFAERASTVPRSRDFA